MRRRGPGVGGIKRHAQVKVALQLKGQEIAGDRVDHARDILTTFRASLETFARKHKAQIRSDPLFRTRFQEMCEAIGVDPLASTGGKRGALNLWGEMLGLGDFYHQLGVRIVELCMVTRSSNGGLMSIHDLTRRLNKNTQRAADCVSEDDVARAVGKLSILGGGFGLIKLQALTMVMSVPLELNADHTSVLAFAATQRGRVSPLQLTAPAAAAGTRQGSEAGGAAGGQERGAAAGGLGWALERAERALQRLAAEGMAWVDTHTESGASGGASGGAERLPQSFSRSKPSAEYWFLSIWLDDRQNSCLLSADVAGAATREEA